MVCVYNRELFGGHFVVLLHHATVNKALFEKHGAALVRLLALARVSICLAARNVRKIC